VASTGRTRCPVEDRDCFAGVFVDVECRVGQSARRRVDDRADRDRHRRRIKVGSEIAGGLEAGEQFGEDVDACVAVAAERAFGAGDRTWLTISEGERTSGRRRRVLEDDDVAGSDSGRERPNHLPVREVPGHDREQHAEREVLDER
jgi:hypothetical protein